MYCTFRDISYLIIEILDLMFKFQWFLLSDKIKKNSRHEILTSENYNVNMCFKL